MSECTTFAAWLAAVRAAVSDPAAVEGFSRPRLMQWHNAGWTPEGVAAHLDGLHTRRVAAAKAAREKR